MDPSSLTMLFYVLMMFLMISFIPIMIILWIVRRVAKSTKKTIYTIRKA